jgi:hypothetical protein
MPKKLETLSNVIPVIGRALRESSFACSSSKLTLAYMVTNIGHDTWIGMWETEPSAKFYEFCETSTHRQKLVSGLDFLSEVESRVERGSQRT